ncbi:response regulator [Sulfurirhabdus autotrophica]|uniref:Two-component system response regulator QseB n=1 Tax=Sulfurirhabdus autotrophica TaxID=1706046 RepID=A0A4R3YI54_9PROT|nr:response regulator [Sulfurirhabdus autotrophica]TCV90313.1 two-component system response regulator QseB [Sulfurirhabdus autotrophica]
MRLLLVEDDTMLGDGVRAGLMQEGFTVDWVQDGASAQLAIQAETYSLIILDLGLPKLSGLDLLKQLRQSGNTIPVLILTARDTVADRVKGLDSGADDYLIKPFDLDELSARIRALLRRNTGRATPQVIHGNIMLDPAAHSVTSSGIPIELSTREFAVLQALLENSGRVMSREQLEQQLYGWNDEVESNAVEVHIHHLRKKLGTELIRTVRGVGYMVDKAKNV